MNDKEFERILRNLDRNVHYSTRYQTAPGRVGLVCFLALLFGIIGFVALVGFLRWLQQFGV